MEIDNGADNLQTQPGAAVFAGSRFVNLVKAFPDAGERIIGDMAAGIENGADDTVSVIGDGDTDASSVGRMVLRVGKQVVDDFLDAYVIRRDDTTSG